MNTDPKLRTLHDILGGQSTANSEHNLKLYPRTYEAYVVVPKIRSQTVPQGPL